MAEPSERASRRAGGDRPAYARAGVDVIAGERAVSLIREVVDSTQHADVLRAPGGYAGVIRLPAGLHDPVLVASTDGVGTKTAIAAALQRLDTVGLDVVAMCADDVVCNGAQPLFFLDYVAVGRLVPEEIAELVGGVAAGCRLAGCALVGGETAEHPGLLPPGSFDLAGFCVGVAERGRLIDGSTVVEGDAVVGLASSGLHSNGFSLVRALLAQYDLDLRTPYQEQLRRSLGDIERDRVMAAEPEHELATLGEVLLTPSRIYAAALLRARGRLEGAGHALRAIAHVTGGGLPGALPRVLPTGLGVRLDPDRWPLPSVMRLLGALAGMEDAELRETFNGGLGMILVVAPGAVGPLLEGLKADGIAGWLVGDIVRTESIGDRRYAEEPLDAGGS